MSRVTLLALVVACLAATVSLEPAEVKSEVIKLSTILPKLQAIHDDARTLSIKNAELKSKILAGLQAQNEAKLKFERESRLVQQDRLKAATGSQQQQQPAPGHPANGAGPDEPSLSKPSPAQDDKNDAINYTELEEFNKWVEMNLDYAVKNVHATIEALKEEASLNNGNVDYSDQAIKDGIEGVKYWRLAVMFQDKTLMGEQFDIERN